MTGHTLPQKAFYDDWSIRQLSEEMLKNGPDSPEHKMFQALLHLRLQERLIRKTWYLVVATWVMAAATWALVIADIAVSS